ncbi:hypothetical protein KFL_002050080 [Klebsormidium nitens]|uniref:Uncharacterized protein n=1 Tax=Klebsormidium nitens TaxID=105231 RepID=A0A1Y1I7V4_KLENI|nr:hypothetical protein KFL_002050080 [Klebsormidium nitens]|eukprot:GAQ84766.1 hypothetical protein KFL_002050080 [Klebsormidium nitens]
MDPEDALLNMHDMPDLMGYDHVCQSLQSAQKDHPRAFSTAGKRAFEKLKRTDCRPSSPRSGLVAASKRTVQSCKTELDGHIHTRGNKQEVIGITSTSHIKNHSEECRAERDPELLADVLAGISLETPEQTWNHDSIHLASDTGMSLELFLFSARLRTHNVNESIRAKQKRSLEKVVAAGIRRGGPDVRITEDQYGRFTVEAIAAGPRAAAGAGQDAGQVDVVAPVKPPTHAPRGSHPGGIQAGGASEMPEAGEVDWENLPLGLGAALRRGTAVPGDDAPGSRTRRIADGRAVERGAALPDDEALAPCADDGVALRRAAARGDHAPGRTVRHVADSGEAALTSANDASMDGRSARGGPLPDEDVLGAARPSTVLVEDFRRRLQPLEDNQNTPLEGPLIDSPQQVRRRPRTGRSPFSPASSQTVAPKDDHEFGGGLDFSQPNEVPKVPGRGSLHTLAGTVHSETRVERGALMPGRQATPSGFAGHVANGTTWFGWGAEELLALGADAVGHAAVIVPGEEGADFIAQSTTRWPGGQLPGANAIDRDTPVVPEGQAPGESTIRCEAVELLGGQLRLGGGQNLRGAAGVRGRPSTLGTMATGQNAPEELPGAHSTGRSAAGVLGRQPPGAAFAEPGTVEGGRCGARVPDGLAPSSESVRGSARIPSFLSKSSGDGCNHWMTWKNLGNMKTWHRHHKMDPQGQAAWRANRNRKHPERSPMKSNKLRTGTRSSARDVSDPDDEGEGGLERPDFVGELSPRMAQIGQLLGGTWPLFEEHAQSESHLGTGLSGQLMSRERGTGTRGLVSVRRGLKAPPPELRRTSAREAAADGTQRTSGPLWRPNEPRRPGNDNLEAAEGALSLRKSPLGGSSTGDAPAAASSGNPSHGPKASGSSLPEGATWQLGVAEEGFDAVVVTAPLDQGPDIDVASIIAAYNSGRG